MRYLLLCLASLLLPLGLSFHSTHSVAHQWWSTHYQKKIGKQEIWLHPEGPWIEVSKWRVANGITLKIYFHHFTDEPSAQEQVSPIAAQHPIQILNLPDRHDGALWTQNRYANLNFQDVDHDGRLELLVPTFDRQLNPRVYAFKYDPLIAQFVRMNDVD